MEINRHKALGRDYEPPESGQRLDGVYQEIAPWTVINAFRHGAQRIFDTAGRLGLRIGSYRGDAYEAGRNLFPELADRMHLAAVLAKCGDFMARAERVVKHIAYPDAPQHDLRTPDKRGVGAELDDGIEIERSAGIERNTVYSI